MLVKSWGRTYGIVWNIVRPTNNYGPHQYPEKLIPKSSWRMRRGLPAIMHGDGSYVRSWLHTEDTADAILTIIEKGEVNRIYNIGSDTELHNIDVLRAIAKLLDVPEQKAWITVEDRSGQDIRYSLDDKALRALGWRPRRRFNDELAIIVNGLDVSRFS
jgi:dTDP-glucose 4,6-dehydratase